MKKIWPLLLLLLLLIILCVWTKKDSIHLSSNTQGSNAVTAVLKTESEHVNYSIKQTGKTYILNGDFTDKEQVSSLSDTCTAAAAQLDMGETQIDKALMGEDAIALTNKILPHFVANYSNGEISYKNKTLVVSGDVEGYASKDTMQTLLNTSTIASTDNTKVLLVESIDFHIKKLPKQLQLSGTFTNKKQIRKITKHLRPTYSTMNLRKNSHRIDKGAIDLTEKILPAFIKNYTNGEIAYTYETLIVKGSVKSQAALDEMNKLLSNSNIAVENFSVLDPMITKQIQAEKEAELAKGAALKQAQENARKEAARKSALAAEQLAKQKTQQETLEKSSKAKQNAQTAKANIAKLLKIENIEFEVAKGSLTQKGKTTVDKLSNIIKQYPDIRIEIAGHTDSDGSAEFNQKLSQARVDTVRERLITKGIQSKQLTAKGYGESKPLVPNTSDENKARNRRVEINTQGN